LLSFGAKSFVFQFLSKDINNKIYGNIILPIVLNRDEIWSLTLRENRGLRMFENRVLSRIFGPKRDEVTGEWRRLHNEELYDLYSLTKYYLGDKIEKNGMGGAYSTYGGHQRCVQGLVGKPEGKRPLGRPRHRWEDTTKVDLQEVG